MDINTLFKSKFMKAADLDQDEETIYTMVAVRMEEMQQTGEERPVLYFKETEQGLVLNKTNATTITKQYGNNTDAWKGKKIALGVDEVEFKGDYVLGIRVRLRIKKAVDQDEAALDALQF